MLICLSITQILGYIYSIVDADQYSICEEMFTVVEEALYLRFFTQKLNFRKFWISCCAALEEILILTLVRTGQSYPLKTFRGFSQRRWLELFISTLIPLGFFFTESVGFNSSGVVQNSGEWLLTHSAHLQINEYTLAVLSSQKSNK